MLFMLFLSFRQVSVMVKCSFLCRLVAETDKRMT